MEMAYRVSEEEKHTLSRQSWPGNVHLLTSYGLIFTGRKQIGMPRAHCEAAYSADVSRQSQLQSALRPRAALSEVPYLEQRRQARHECHIQLQGSHMSITS
jgi:DNA-binding NtrC family response regulator